MSSTAPSNFRAAGSSRIQVPSGGVQRIQSVQERLHRHIVCRLEGCVKSISRGYEPGCHDAPCACALRRRCRVYAPPLPATVSAPPQKAVMPHVQDHEWSARDDELAAQDAERRTAAAALLHDHQYLVAMYIRALVRSAAVQRVVHDLTAKIYTCNITAVEFVRAVECGNRMIR